MNPTEKRSTTHPNYLHKKNSKPLMEKKRRARINASLIELKSLLIDAIKEEGKNSKLEKADILEIAVRYLKKGQRDQFLATAAVEPRAIDTFRAGYAECASEVTRYLASTEGLEPDLRARLLNHLVTCVSAVQRGDAPLIREALFTAMTCHRSVASLPTPPAKSPLPPDSGASSVESFGLPDPRVLDLTTRGDVGALWRPW